MYDPMPMQDDAAFAAVARRVLPEGRLLRYWRLEGGVSASVHALEIEDPARQLRRVVVRRHGADFKSLGEDVTAREFRLLAALRRAGMPVPEPLLLDDSCDVLSTPYLVMALVEGTTAVSVHALPEALRQMAEFLARLHAIDLEEAGLPPLSDLEDPCQGILEHLPPGTLGDRLRLALSNLGTWAPDNPASLLHGDFWPGNVLWRQGRIAAVLDWEDASIGDPLSDLACCRVELLCAYDEAAMDAFTEQYLTLSRVDVGNLALWEVYVAAAAVASMASWGLAPEVEAERWRKTVRFMERAAHDLLARSC